MHHFSGSRAATRPSTARAPSPRDPAADVELAKKLSGHFPPHMSPFEHVAQALPDARPSGNFLGWKQFRKEFADEHVGGPRP